MNSVLKNNADGVVIWNIDGTIRNVNPAFEEIFGWEKEALLGTRLEVFPHGMVKEVYDKFEFVYVSPSYERILGYKPDDLLGKNALEFLHPDDHETIIPLMATHNGEPVSAKAEYRYKIGKSHKCGHR